MLAGEGQDAVLLSRLGAEVTGLDISQGAIEVAQKRCALEGVTARFMCVPIEEASVPGEYDVSGRTRSSITFCTIWTM